MVRLGSVASIFARHPRRRVAAFETESSASDLLVLDEYQCMDECRIGATAPMSDTPARAEKGRSSGLMACAARGRISVDLGGLKAALAARARARGTLPSAFVREALAAALGQGAVIELPRGAEKPPATDTVRLSLRLPRQARDALLSAAQTSGLSTGDFVAGLLSQAPALTDAAGATARLATLTASCAELATLSRNLNHLTTLLRQGSGRAAQEYRAMLDEVGADVRAHLALASSVAAELQPLVRPRRPRAAQAVG